ncbi:serine protease Hayan [Drosophila grimshawi]|uniref:serine protease Hayan n=1 Tax=Drosophila grimshawi TaxID=7222 RepID=UPI0013EF4849|nr:serine protease Hayan [Drosophila grimshawi]
MTRMRASLTTGSLLLCVLLLGKLSNIEAFEEGDACMVKENLPGVCKISSKCEPVLDDYFKTGVLTIDDVPSCGLGPHEEIICCPIAECCGSKTRPETTTLPTNRVFVPDGERPAKRACHQFQKSKERNGQPLSPHILGGTEVELGTYPHMAAIAFSVVDKIVFSCGGTLISSRHVLTAAHCVSKDLPLYVRLGAVNISGDLDHQDINVTSNVVLHPDYVSSTKYNDIAVLELAKEVTLDVNVSPACLAFDSADPPETAQLYVAGWGIMNLKTKSTSMKLMRAPLNTVPLKECNDSYAKQPSTMRHLPQGVIDSLLCAADTKNSTADACQGDSGGPLILEEDFLNNKYSILGIVNSGVGCVTKTPGLYTRVASYVDWIEQVVWPNNVV